MGLTESGKDKLHTHIHTTLVLVSLPASNQPLVVNEFDREYKTTRKRLFGKLVPKTAS